MRSAQRLKSVFCKNGGVFIKVGQHIGGLDYLLPDEYVNTMKDLHNNAPESKVSELFETVETDLKCKVGKFFKLKIFKQDFIISKLFLRLLIYFSRLKISLLVQPVWRSVTKQF